MAYYPILLGQVYLSDQHATADTARQASLDASAEALIAENSAFNPICEAFMGLGILFLSVAMLTGVFPRIVAYLRIATAIAAFVGLSFYPIVELGYFFWWAFGGRLAPRRRMEAVQAGENTSPSRHLSAAGSRPTGPVMVLASGPRAAVRRAL